MDNGNDPPARITCLEISDKNMIPTNSGLMLKEWIKKHKYAYDMISPYAH